MRGAHGGQEAVMQHKTSTDVMGKAQAEGVTILEEQVKRYLEELSRVNENTFATPGRIKDAAKELNRLSLRSVKPVPRE